VLNIVLGSKMPVVGEAAAAELAPSALRACTEQQGLVEKPDTMEVRYATELATIDRRTDIMYFKSIHYTPGVALLLAAGSD